MAQLRDEDQTREQLLEEVLALRQRLTDLGDLAKEKKEAASALMHSEELNKRIIEALPGGIVQIRVDGRVVQANQAAQDLLGLSYDEFKRQYVSDFGPKTIWEDGSPCPPEEYPVSRALATASRQGPATIGVLRPDGDVTWAVFTAIPVRDLDGALWGAIVTFLDITERKKMEEALRRSRDELELRVSERTKELSRAIEDLNESIEESRRLEEQLRQSQKLEAVGKLAGGIAHDFNNILLAICGYTELISRQIPKEANLQNFLQKIIKNTEKAATLTKQMLAFSRKSILQPKKIDLNIVVSEMEEMLRRVISENIELLTKNLDQPCTITADRLQIEQIIVNLVINSQDAMPQGGLLKIEIAKIYLKNSDLNIEPGNYAILSVVDNGLGMAPEIQERIFEPFFTTKAPGKGSGLGLSMVYGAVIQMGGYITLKTEPLKGTTFNILFPVCDELTDESSPVIKAITNHSGNGTILLVEDDDELRLLFLHILKENGYNVTEASNGESALNTIEQIGYKFDLLISDIIMPKMTGEQLAAQVKEKSPGMKIIYMSGYMDTTASRALRTDSVFLAKPFPPSVLLEAVASLLPPSK